MSRPSDMPARFSRAMLPHMDAVYNFACYLSRNPSVAEDVAQEAFLRAYRGFDSWRGDGAKAWLLTIVRNCFLDQLNASAGVSVTDIQESTGELPHELIIEENPESLLAEKRDAAIVRAVLHTLPQPFRETLILREIEEMNYKEIATITQVSIGTVMSRLSRARRLVAGQSNLKSASEQVCSSAADLSICRG